MSFQVEKKGKIVVLKVLAERLDGNVSPSLKAEVTVVSGEGNKNMIMDLSPVRYCDSSGLSAVLVANRLCKNSNGTFVLIGLQDAVRKLISISQLDSILNITKNIEEASEKIELAEIEREAESEH